VALPHRRRSSLGVRAWRNLLGGRRVHRPQFHHLHLRARWTAGRCGRRLQLSPRSTGAPDCAPTGESSVKLTLPLTLLLTVALTAAAQQPKGADNCVPPPSALAPTLPAKILPGMGTVHLPMTTS